jgi:hypothetical protein
MKESFLDNTNTTFQITFSVEFLKLYKALVGVPMRALD